MLVPGPAPPFRPSYSSACMSDDGAWALARDAAELSGVAIRELGEVTDTDRVTSIIEVVWGPQAMPTALLRAFQHAGSVFLGAFAGEEMVGFVLGFLGWKESWHVHSHMLAVLPGWQSKGVGYALKLGQRAACLDRGIDEVRWTYDPLVLRNARFNLVRLGAVGTAFFPGFYGEMPDRLNRGDRSDRFEVRWRLRSAVAQARLEDRMLAIGRHGYPSILQCQGPPGASRPVETGAWSEGGVTLTIPRDYHALRGHDPELGARWRVATARAFALCFERGMVATWIDPDGRYVFERDRGSG